jgi:hypothetical protein
MFLSKDDLKLGFGVDMEIGRFFVDRKVPQDNYYWRKRLLYMHNMPGYLFIPVYTDIAYRLGLPKEQLLSEDYVTLAEDILNSAGKLEFNLCTYKEHIEECIDLARAKCNNTEFLNDLIYYFNGEKEKATVELGTPFKSLNRADTYLFSLCYFSFNREQKEKLAESWKALMTYYLIMDDLDDIKEDIKNQEENALIDAGLNEKGAEIIESMYEESYKVLLKVNPVLANRMDYKRHYFDVKKIISSFLTEKPVS